MGDSTVNESTKTFTEKQAADRLLQSTNFSADNLILENNSNKLISRQQFGNLLFTLDKVIACHLSKTSSCFIASSY